MADLISQLGPIQYSWEIESPREWPHDRALRGAVISAVEDNLRSGKAVWVPLLFDGDEFSLDVPEGVYFLNYTCQLRRPSPEWKSQELGVFSQIEASPVGPYFVEIATSRNQPIQYTPKMGKMEFATPSALTAFLRRLLDLGAEAQMLEFYSKPAQRAQVDAIAPESSIQIRCLHCDELSPEKANFCSNCGTRLRRQNGKEGKE